MTISPANGPLDGLTILRFAHAYAAGAGLEYDLAVINEALGARSRLKTILVHLARGSEALETTVENQGRSQLIRVPVRREMMSMDEVPGKAGLQSLLLGARAGFRDYIVFNSLFYRLIFKRILAAKTPKKRREDVSGAGMLIRKLLTDYPVDLVVLHSVGGHDAWEIIKESRHAGIPVAVQLHFANERFKHASVRLQVAMVQGVGGVSNVGVPKYLRERYVNLLTAVDLTLFSKEAAATPPARRERFILLLPARIVPTKGHQDLIEAADILIRQGLSVEVVFAGRADRPEFEAELKAKTRSLGIEKHFRFVGLLSPKELRDWYAVADVMAFPTYHHEGLPRIVLEAQAMRVPVVVYDTGGTRAALVDGVSGYVVQTGNVLGLAQKIGELLRNESLRTAMGAEGRRYLESEYNLQALAERHEKFYDRTLSLSLGRPGAQNPYSETIR